MTNIANMPTKKLYCNNSFLSSNLSAFFDGEVTIPDYLPDINTVVRLDANPYVMTITTADGKVSFDGKTECVLLYMSEESPSLQSYSFKLPFNESYLDKNILANSRFSCNVAMDNIYCKPTNSRKLTVNGEMTISFVGENTEQYEIVDASTVPASIETLITKEDFALFTSSEVKDFTVLENLTLEEGYPAMERLLKTDCDIMLVEMKVVSDKVVIKGCCKVKAIYIGDVETGAIEEFSGDIPFNQVVDANGATDESIINATLSVLDCSFGTEDDENGITNILNCKINVKAEVNCYENQNVEIVTDAYAKDSEIICQSINLVAEQLAAHNFCEANVSEEIDLAGEISAIYTGEAYASLKECAYDKEKNEIYFNGNIFMTFLAKNMSGEIVAIDEIVPFTCSSACHDDEMREYYFLGNAVIDKFTYRATDSAKIMAEAVISCEAFLRAKSEVKATQSIEITDKVVPQLHMLTIYFPQEGESLWEIGKKYNTLQSTLRENNNIASDNVPSGINMLIIER